MLQRLFIIGTTFIIGSYSLNAQTNPQLPDIPVEVFVNNGKTDFEQIIYTDDRLEESVKRLFDYDLFPHEITVSTVNFPEYWERYKAQWKFIKFKKNAAPLLLFTGLRGDYDEREFVEIYNIEQRRQLFNEVGKLLAYNINPFTQELVLFTHSYPCCKSASHNIYTIRQLNGELTIKDVFFVGRSSKDMVGPFFSETADHSSQYFKLKEKTALRWSPAIVEENAFLGWANSNLMIHYDVGAVYKVIKDEGDWQFVLFFSGIVEEESRVMNYTNFKNKGVYGWIKK